MQEDQSKQHLELLELAYLEADGELQPGEIRELNEHSVSCAECRTIRSNIPQLHSVLGLERIEPDPDLARRVLENLPPAAWEMRRPGSWRFAALALVGLMGVAYLLMRGSDPLGDALPWFGTLAAMAELFRSAILAGAGLLAASWSGTGLALGEILSRSPFGFTALGFFVLGLDYLFLRYLWRLSRRGGIAGRRLPNSRNGFE